MTSCYDTVSLNSSEYGEYDYSHHNESDSTVTTVLDNIDECDSKNCSNASECVGDVRVERGDPTEYKTYIFTKRKTLIHIYKYTSKYGCYLEAQEGLLATILHF